MMADRADELSLAEIGRRLGVSRERARQLEARAKQKLRRHLETHARRARRAPRRSPAQAARAVPRVQRVLTHEEREFVRLGGRDRGRAVGVAVSRDAAAEELRTLTLEPSADVPRGPDPLLITTGVVIFGVPYGFSAAAAGASNIPSDKWLYVPVVGPWGDIIARLTCTTTDCQGNLGPAALPLVLSGLGQAAGVGILIKALIDPPGKSARSASDGEPRPRARRADDVRRRRSASRPLARSERTHKSRTPEAEARARGSTSLCKPSSVSRPGHPERGGDHSSRTAVTRRLEQPTRRLGRAALHPDGRSRLETPAYAALLPMGFAMPPALPRARWALTPPFHPYRRAAEAARRRRFSFLLHSPRRFRHRALPGIVLCGARTFLPPRAVNAQAGDRPSGVDAGNVHRERLPPATRRAGARSDRAARVVRRCASPAGEREGGHERRDDEPVPARAEEHGVDGRGRRDDGRGAWARAAGPRASARRPEQRDATGIASVARASRAA